MWWSFWVTTGALFGGLSVGLGAFAAHGLKARLPAESISVFETAARYQMYHALALLFLGLLSIKIESWLVISSGFFFSLGIVLFSGSLYALVLTNYKALGMVTPIGGIFLMLGWFSLFLAAIKIPFS